MTYGLAINNANHPRDIDGTLLNHYLDGLTQRCGTLPGAYSAHTGPLPLDTQLPQKDPHQPTERGPATSFASGAASGSNSLTSTPVDLANSSSGRTQLYHSVYEHKLEELGGRSDFPLSECSKTIAASMRAAFAKHGVGMNAAFEDTIEQISRHKAKKIDDRRKRTGNGSRSEVDLTEFELEELDDKDVWPKLCR